MLTKILIRLKQEFRNLLYSVITHTSSVKNEVENNVPFVCQFAHPKHAELSLKKKLNPEDDVLWTNTGASSADRYADWAFTMCGMASFAMIYEYYFDAKQQPVILAEDALQHGVYNRDFNGILSSMKYQEFSLWIKRYNLRANVISRLSVSGIQHALSRDKLVIVSVNPNIRGYNTAPVTQKGGHLVVVTGYDKNANTISINNSSGFASLDTQVNHVIKLKEFKKHYAGRGIIISK